MKKNKLILLSGIIIMLLVLPFCGLAKMDQNVYVSADEEIYGNYLMAGQNVELSGHFHKDVYVWGNMVTISGQVDGDVIAAGSYIRITGDVGGNVRAAGSTVEIGGKVGKNAMIAAGVLDIKKDAEINWDLLVAGGIVNVEGPVLGYLTAAAGNLQINSLVGQGVAARIDKDGQFILQQNAKIQGDVRYKAEKEIVTEQGAIIEGEIIKEKIAPIAVKEDTAGSYIGMQLFKFAALLLVGLILLAIAGKCCQSIAAKMTEKFGLSLGIGFLVLILTPLAFIILFATIVGIPLALILIAAYAILLYLSKVFASLMIGNLVMKKIFKKKKVDKYLGFLVGLVILSIIGLIPILGSLVWFVLGLIGFGALLLVCREMLKAGK